MDKFFEHPVLLTFFVVAKNKPFEFIQVFEANFSTTTNTDRLGIQ